MTPQPIPDEHHVSRYAKNKLVYPSLIGERYVDPMVFRLRPNEQYLSVDWLEYFGGDDLRQQLDQVRNVLITIRRYDVEPKSAFAIVNVQEIKAAGRNCRSNLSVLTTDNQNDPSHSGIYGLPQIPEDEFLLEEIASCARVEDVWG